ncbi:MAG: DNA translocase FtsK [Saprospirales bacterium]|nr:DNA translocase FtsK [Saprospirales bacterium]
MSAKKKQKKGQLSLRLGINDERTPKLLGLLCLFLTFYLFIALVSYLFTWRADQDKVLRFSWWQLFRADLQMDNWLGRLGAIISNMFFYWGFGLPSFILVFLIGFFGWNLIQRRPVMTMWPLTRQLLILMVALSILLEFVLFDASFPWGGAFGESASKWLTGFVGNIGMIALILFIFVGLVVWFTNPNFNELTFRKLVEDVRYWAENLLNRRGGRRGTTTTALAEPEEGDEEGDEEEAELANRPLRPSSAHKENRAGGGDGPLLFDLDEEMEEESAKRPNLSDTELEIEPPVTEPGASQDPVEKKIGTPAMLDDVMETPFDSEPYDPTLELSSYEFPILSLLNDYADQKIEIDRTELEANKDQIIATLLNYKIEIVKIRATIGPTVTLYEIIPAPGVRISRIKNLEDDIALSLSALGIRIIAPIPGRGTIGIEVPNKKKQIVSLKEVLMSDKFRRAKMDLPVGLGKTISNEVFVGDLAKMPHLLVAGATGQGKSVGINAILISFLYRMHPATVKFVLIDPKKVELFPYSRLENHFLAFLPGQDEPITTETSKVINVLNSLCIEMDNRYDMLKRAHARNIREYNEKFVQRRLNPEKGHKFLPFIILVIDEFADLIMTAGKEIELPIGRLAQLARAVGIHLVIATQRPSVNIITGVIKANFPARVAFKVTSKVDSRTILDAGGADQLIGRGDMLLSVGGDMIRLQSAFVDTPEVEKVIDFIANQRGFGEPYYLPEYYGDEETHGTAPVKYSDLDEMFEDAARLIVQNQHGSTSMIQRRMKLGYNRAGRIMDQLEAMGVVGPSEGSKAREVLIYDEVELERYLEDLKARK